MKGSPVGTPNGHGKAPAPAPPINITTQVTFVGCTLNVVKGPDGSRDLQIIDPASGTLHSLPLSPELARNLGKELISALPIVGADEMPV